MDESDTGGIGGTLAGETPACMGGRCGAGVRRATLLRMCVGGVAVVIVVVVGHARCWRVWVIWVKAAKGYGRRSGLPRRFVAAPLAQAMR